MAQNTCVPGYEIFVKNYRWITGCGWVAPKDAKAYFNRGVSWYGKGDHDKAIADYTKAIELNPTYAEAYYNRGNAWDEKGDSDKAIADFSRAIELSPNYADAYNSRGIAWGERETTRRPSPTTARQSS